MQIAKCIVELNTFACEAWGAPPPLRRQAHSFLYKLPFKTSIVKLKIATLTLIFILGKPIFFRINISCLFVTSKHLFEAHTWIKMLFLQQYYLLYLWNWNWNYKFGTQSAPTLWLHRTIFIEHPEKLDWRFWKTKRVKIPKFLHRRFSDARNLAFRLVNAWGNQEAFEQTLPSKE